MSGRDWTRARNSKRIATRGYETVDGLGILHGAPKPRPSKAQLRAEVSAATAALSAAGSVTRKISWQCGRSGTITIRAAKLRAPIRCQGCRRVMK